MKKSDMMITLAASLGVGAATFYSMSKSHQPLNKAIEHVTPMLNSMVSDTGMSMQTGMNSNNSSSGQQNQFNPNQNTMS